MRRDTEKKVEPVANTLYITNYYTVQSSRKLPAQFLMELTRIVRHLHSPVQGLIRNFDRRRLIFQYREESLLTLNFSLCVSLSPGASLGQNRFQSPSASTLCTEANTQSISSKIFSRRADQRWYISNDHLGRQESCPTRMENLVERASYSTHTSSGSHPFQSP